MRNKTSRSYHTFKVSHYVFIISLREIGEDCHKEGENAFKYVGIHLPGSVAAGEALSEMDGCNLIKKRKKSCVLFM